MSIDVRIGSKLEGLVMSKETRVSVRVLMAARPAEVARVAQMLGNDTEMAAYFIVKEGGDVEATCLKLEAALERLAKTLFEETKQRAPVDTGELRNTIASIGPYASRKFRAAHYVNGRAKEEREAMTGTEAVVRRRLMLSTYPALLADVAQVMNCDVEECADELGSTFRGETAPYIRAVVEEVERRFGTRPTAWTTRGLRAWQTLLLLREPK